MLQIIDTINQTQLMPSRASLEASFNASIEQAMADYETKDLLVKVHKPEKVVKAMESYVSFTVSTKVILIVQLSNIYIQKNVILSHNTLR